MNNLYRIYIIFLIVFMAVAGRAESRSFDSLRVANRIDSIDAAHANINYSGQYRTSFYTALAHFPTLKNVHIEFRYRNISTTMQCRPKAFSVLRRKDKRKYLMVFNQNAGKTKGATLNQLSFNARVGLFAHEIAHIVDYQRKRTGKIAKTGMQYTTKRGKIRLEHSIDRLLIWKGLGFQIHAYAKQVLNNQEISDNYRNRRTTFYLQPAEIEELIRIVENIH
ncbi:MAG: hypothetical protein R6U85_10690 [Salinivirgaceae bacterium]